MYAQNWVGFMGMSFRWFINNVRGKWTAWTWPVAKRIQAYGGYSIGISILLHTRLVYLFLEKASLYNMFVLTGDLEETNRILRHT